MAYVFAKLWTPKDVVRLMSRKSPFSGPLDMQRGKWGKKTFSISTAALLPYLLITVKAIELERVSDSDMENLKTLC